MRTRPAPGWSLPALMVGLTLGGMVSGALLQTLMLHGRSQAEALRDARLAQEGRAMLSLIARELRRARLPLDPDLPAWTLGPELRYLGTGPAGTEVARAWRLRDGSLQWQLAPGSGFQTVNDPAVLRVRRLELSAEAPETRTLGHLCPEACTAGSLGCPVLEHPLVRLRLDLEAAGRPARRFQVEGRVWPRAPRQRPGPCPAARP